MRRLKSCFFFLTALSLVLFLLPGCSSLPTTIPTMARPFPDAHGSALLDTLVHDITSELSTVSPEEFSPDKRLLIATFVDLNDLRKTSAFGRLLSERLMTSMGDLGFTVIEIRRGGSVYVIDNEGEMVLTRNVREIPDTIHAGAVIYGTYLVSEREVLVTARIARSSDFRILKSWNGRVSRTAFIAGLLEDDNRQPDGTDGPGEIDDEIEVYEHLPAE
ncbi:MAG: FlgO family outer membrane protein [bacterium]